MPAGLAAALGGADLRKRAAIAMAALGALAQPALGAVNRALWDEMPIVRERAVAAIEAIGAPARAAEPARRSLIAGAHGEKLRHGEEGGHSEHARLIGVSLAEIIAGPCLESRALHALAAIGEVSRLRPLRPSGGVRVKGRGPHSDP